MRNFLPFWRNSCPTEGPGPNRIGGNSMRFRTSMCLATLFLFCFTIAAWSTPHPILAAGHSQPTPDNQSLSGQITSVGDAEFSVGAQATVEYRSNEGKNIAVHVIVTPTSGMNSY